MSYLYIDKGANIIFLVLKNYGVQPHDKYYNERTLS